MVNWDIKKVTLSNNILTLDKDVADGINVVFWPNINKYTECVRTKRGTWQSVISLSIQEIQQHQIFTNLTKFAMSSLLVTFTHNICYECCRISLTGYVGRYAFCMVFHVRWIFLTTSLRIPPESLSDEGGIRRRVVRNPSHMENHTKCIFSHTLHFKAL